MSKFLRRSSLMFIDLHRNRTWIKFTAFDDARKWFNAG